MRNGLGPSSEAMPARTTAPGRILVAAAVAGLFVIVAPATSRAQFDPINLAQGMFARQSSDYPWGGGDAWHATDGSTDGNFWDGSVTHTDYQTNPWWEVDLGSVRQIGRVEIANRTDCCSERLVPFMLLVAEFPILDTDITDDATTARAGVQRTVMSGPVQASYVVPVNRPGRFVRVALLGTNYLSLAEVSVLEADSAARGRPTSQSSTIAGGESSHAVDANITGSFANGTVSATTANEARPWWQVDLGLVLPIREIHVWSTNADCCSTIRPPPGFRIWISSTPFTPDSATGAQPAGTLGFPSTNGVLGTATQGSPAVVPIDAQGRYVAIQLMGNDSLSLSEVQVWTVARGSVGGHAHLSTVHGSATEDGAMDFKTGFFTGGAATEVQDQPYWEVDLGGRRYIESVKIWNMGSNTTVPYYYVFASNTDFVDSAGARLTQISQLTSMPGISYWIERQATPFDGTPVTSTAVMRQARFVRIMLPGTNALGIPEAEIVTTEGYVIAQNKNNASVETGNPVNTQIAVSGYFPRPNVPVDVYAYNPTGGLDSGGYSFLGTAMTGTTAIATNFAVAPMYNFFFSGAVMPAGSWPQGGMAGLLYSARDNDGTTATPLRGVDLIAGREHVYWPEVRIVSATPTPDGTRSANAYLTLPMGRTPIKNYYGDGSIIPSKYADFKKKYGYPDSSISATYYNAGDLGIGRAMSCKRLAPWTTCAVDNWATTDSNGDVVFGDPAKAGGPNAHLQASVVMVISDTNRVPVFGAYGSTGFRQNSIQLDSTGINTAIPNNCMACHGGNGGGSGGVFHASFLPFDVDAFQDLGNNRLANQSEGFRKLNSFIVSFTSADTAIRDLVNGWYNNRAGVANTPFNGSYVPAGWSSTPAKAKAYSEVIKPYCRTCHISQDRGLDFLKASDADNLRATIVSAVCKQHIMPHAQQTMKRFWASGARAQLLGYFGRHDYEPETCTP